MATVDDVRRIALSLPETDDHPSHGGRSAFRVRKKGFCYIREDGESLALPVADFDEKEALLAADPEKFFTTPHYDGYAMVCVRWSKVGGRELRELLTDAWRLKAPKKLLAAFDAGETGRV